MITIIKRGPKEVVTCKNCGCLFSYEKTDIVYKDLDNYKACECCVVCPQCNQDVVLSRNKYMGQTLK